MKISASIAILLVFSSFVLPGQPAARDLLVSQNDFERGLFEKMALGDTSHMGLLLASSGRADSMSHIQYLAVLDRIMLSLDSAKLRRKNPKKQIKKIFESVHEELLRKYELENQFIEIFESGNYNCVSATAVYCYMLNGLGIPFSVMESPNHVYAVAFIEDELWVMESTDPQQGYYEIDDDLYEEQLEQIIAQKLITPEQAQSEKIDSILQALFPNRSISTADLVSFQYANQAIYDYEKAGTFPVFQNALKSYLISRNAYQEQLFIESLGIWLGDNDYENPVFFDAAAYFLNTDTMQKQPDFVKNSFIYYGNQWLVDSISDRVYESMFKAYYAGTSANSELRKEIEMVYHLIKAEKLGTQGQFVAAYKASAKGMRLLRHEDAINYVLINLSQLQQQEIWSAAQAADTMYALQSWYEETRAFSKWNSFYAELLLQEIYYLLDYKEFTSIAKLRADFEAVMDNEDLEKMVSPRMIGMVYSRLALHDYNRSKAQAAQTIQRGFKYAPNSTELKKYQEMLRL